MGEQDEKRDVRRRGEDTAYTINHAIACTATDFGAPIISHNVARRFFHSHSSLWQWFAGEGIGDLAAVPATIAIERAAPGLTNGIRKGMEKTLGWAFRRSARREANAWARGRGLDADSPEAEAKGRSIYNYEIDHLPQAAIWTATSMAFNIVTQKLFHASLHKNHSHGGHSVAEIAGALVVGKGVSTGAVIGLRAAFPDKAHQWDSFTARHVFAPLNRAAERFIGRKHHDGDWETRAKAPSVSPARNR